VVQIGVMADHCRKLQILELTNCFQLSDNAIKSIASGTDGRGGLHELRSLTFDSQTNGIFLDQLVTSCKFLEKLSFPKASFEPPQVLKLCNLAYLRHFNIFTTATCLFTRELLEALLQGCPQLEHLALCVDWKSKCVFEAFSTISTGLNGLVLAAFGGRQWPFEPLEFQGVRHIIRGCPRLQSLKLYNVSVETLPLALQHLPELRSLSLDFMETEEDDPTELSGLERETREERNKIMKDHAAGSILIASPLLRSLQLSNVPGLTYEAASPNKQVLSAEAMANIAKHSSKLEEFKIVNAQIETDLVLEALACSLPRHSLRNVQLFNCSNTTDKGIIALITGCGQNIVELDLRALPFLTNNSLDAIFHHCGMLQSLFISQNSNINQQTVFQIKEEHPHTNIYHF